MAGTIDRDLEAQLQALRQQSGDTVKVEDIGEVVRSLLGTLSGEMSAADRSQSIFVREVARATTRA